MYTQPIFKNKDYTFATIFILIGIVLQLHENNILSSEQIQNLKPILNYCIQKFLEVVNILISPFSN